MAEYWRRGSMTLRQFRQTFTMWVSFGAFVVALCWVFGGNVGVYAFGYFVAGGIVAWVTHATRCLMEP